MLFDWKTTYYSRYDSIVNGEGLAMSPIVVKWLQKQLEW